jgi:ABC-type amino acid transport substrate-binding protein/nitrogen-specific signal transduction histidine kinase
MKKLCGLGWLLFCLFGPAAADSAAPASTALFALAPEEQAWLAEHPEIRVGVMADWPPLDFTDSAGQPAGIGVDLLTEMNRLLGGVLRIQSGTFEGNLRKARDRDLDALLDVSPAADRSGQLAFTRPYLDIPDVIVGRRNVRYYPSAISLTGHTLALERGSENAQWFRDNFPAVRIREFNSTREALDAVARSQVDAYAGNRAVALYLLEREMLTNLMLQGRLEKPAAALAIGVRSDWPVAAALLDRALGAVLERDAKAILAKWFETASKVGGLFQPPREEQEWLAAHPQILLGIASDRPPMNFLDGAGTARGIGMDFIGLLNERLEGRLVGVPTPRADLAAECRAGKLDAAMDLVSGVAGDEAFHFTRPYASLPRVIVGRKGGEHFDSFESLEGRTVVVESASPLATYIRANHPGIHLVECPTLPDALAEFSAGNAEACVGNRAVAIWVIARELLSNLEIQGPVRGSYSETCIGVRKDQPLLAAILGRALASLSPDGVQEIYERWGGVGKDPRVDLSWIRLSPEEKQWLDSHPVIRFGSNPRWAPLEFIDKDGIPQGISRDFLQRFGNALGVEFRHVPIPSWWQAQAKLRDGEVDLLSSMTKAGARQQDFVFTPPYLSLQTAIFTRQETPYVGSVAELKNLRVATVPGHAMKEYLLSQCPGIKLQDAKDVPAALKMLESGAVDALAGSLLITSHYIQEGGYARIKVAGETGFVYQPAFACRKEWRILVDILDKVLDGIDEQEKNTLVRKWMAVTYEQHVDYTKLYKYVAGALALLGLFFYWNRRMAAEIRRRRAVEKSLLKSEEALVAANKELEAFSYSVSHDLRAPLRHVAGFVQLLQANSKDRLDETGVRYLEVIAGAARKMGQLIDDLLSFSRTGRAQIHLETIPLGALVDECRRELEPEMKGRTIEWVVGELPEVEADRALLRQVLANLLGNAVKYSRKAAAARIAVSARREGGEIVVCVRDNGAGFDMKYADKLFGVFQRLHTEAEFDGTGIGLANVRRIVVRHGGRTWAEGEVDKGAAFYFSLPVQPASHDKEETP